MQTCINKSQENGEPVITLVISEELDLRPSTPRANSPDTVYEEAQNLYAAANPEEEEVLGHPWTFDQAVKSEVYQVKSSNRYDNQIKHTVYQVDPPRTTRHNLYEVVEQVQTVCHYDQDPVHN